MRTKAALVALTFAAALVASPAFAHTHEKEDVVYDLRGAPVTSAVTGDCVYAANQMADSMNPCNAARAPQMDMADRTFLFDFDSAKLTKDATMKLDKIATVIKAAGNQHTATITGFADRVGSEKYNIALSMRRAKAVEKYLKAKGVAHASVSAVKGLGETVPVTDCAGDKIDPKLVACLKPDRRVEITIE